MTPGFWIYSIPVMIITLIEYFGTDNAGRMFITGSENEKWEIISSVHIFA
jgi:hypothetical protein